MSKQLPEKLEHTFDRLDPECYSMMAFQEKINELIDYLHEKNREYETKVGGNGHLPEFCPQCNYRK